MSIVELATDLNILRVIYMTTDEFGASLQTSAAVSTKTTMGPGLRLRKIREAKHINLEEIAKHIRLNVERLNQIENDDYRLMGAPAFAKGYLRAYANQLGIANEETVDILQAFDELHLGENVKRSAPELIHEKIDPVNPKSARWLSYLIVVLLLGLLGYLYYQHFSGLNKVTSNNEIPAQTTNTKLPINAINNLAPEAITPAMPIESALPQPKATETEVNSTLLPSAEQSAHIPPVKNEAIEQ